MTSRLTLRSSAPHGGAPWEIDAVPLAYEEAGRQQLRAMPGVRWLRDPTAPNGRGFYRGASEALAVVVALLESAGVLRVTDERRETPLTADTERMPISVAGGLRGYQQDGAGWVAWMCQATGAALLADEMGIGKTAQAIRALDALGSGTAIVAAPKVALSQWKTQIERWSTRDAQSRAWLLFSHEKLARMIAKGEVPAASYIVLDEIHYYANPTAKRTVAMRSLLAARRAVGSLRGVVALSGTPMTTRPRDLWAPLDLLWPGRFGKRFEYEKRYCNGRFEQIEKVERSVWVADGITRAEELGVRLGAVMLRRMKAQLHLELPPRSREILEVEIPKAALRDSRRAAAAIDWSRPHAASISSLLSEVEGFKLDAAEELAREVVAAGSRPLLLTTRKASAKELAKRLADLGAAEADGDLEATERQARLADASVGVATMFSVTTGIDLVGYDVVIFVGLDWVPSTLLQAAARVHRLGQTRAVTEYYLIAMGTLDEVVRSKVIERLDTFDRIVGGGAANGDEAELAADLRGGGTEDQLLADFAAACVAGA